jgi:hypothetical protein
MMLSTSSIRSRWGRMFSGFKSNEFIGDTVSWRKKD